MANTTEHNNTYPYLSKIDSPADLKKLPTEALPAVCDELRRFIIEELSHNPGHLASSLGSIELTVALHYVFNTPSDQLVWDVGHQAYAHKILTGRASVSIPTVNLRDLRLSPRPPRASMTLLWRGMPATLSLRHWVLTSLRR